MKKNSLRIKIKNELSSCKDCINNDIINIIKGKNIALYHPIKYELDIDRLYKYLKDNDYNIYYPYTKIIDNDFILEFHKDYNMVYDDYKILSSDGEKIDINKIDTIIVPGLAYNKLGYRLGRGKGCYDKALSNYKGLLIGACFDKAIVDEEFQEGFDIKVDYIVSEKEIIKVEA